MTPEARAKLCYDTIEAFGWEIRWARGVPIPDDAWPRDIIQREIVRAEQNSFDTGYRAAGGEIHPLIINRTK